jgi:ABC-type nitrate/sulfonate/bicarbonate transport system permease component
MSDSPQKLVLLGSAMRSPAAVAALLSDAHPGQRLVARTATTRRRHMGKYFLAWLLGVPAVVLVLIYFFMR